MLNGTDDFSKLDVDNISIDGNTVVTVGTNQDLVLDPNGSGRVLASKLIQTENLSNGSGTYTQLSFDGGIVLKRYNNSSGGGTNSGYIDMAGTSYWSRFAYSESNRRFEMHENGTMQFWFHTSGNAGANGVFQDNAWDLAEEYDVEENASDVGTVLTVCENADMKMCQTTGSYQIVTGVISFHTAQLSNNFNADRYGDEYKLPPKDNPQPVGIKGLVKTKVTNENGIVKRGDILISSSQNGKAMRIDDDKKMTINDRYIVGIAMENCSDPECSIWVQR
jgi:hypothetical protein